VKANTAETRLKRTTPIGVFPEGDTPDGISDLAGNSSDWTLSPYTDHLEVPDEVPEASAGAGDDASLVQRVGRGGSWITVGGYAHNAHRFRGDPSFRNFGIGFRVVCVSPIR
jgi:formylglycine-generating enzyme required for sulfatase activity